MLTPLDHVLVVATTLVSPLIDWLWLYPLLRRATAAGVQGARSRAYLYYLVTVWGLTAGVLALWANHGRPWAGLRLGLGTPLQSVIGLVLAAAYLGLGLAQRRALLAQPDRLARVFARFGAIVPLLPHTSGERGGFALVSVTAGVCEEILFRGFVMWYVSVWAGPVFAVLISSILFGFGHLYLSPRDAIRTGLVGLLFALVVLAAGSLWPAILIHAAADLLSGDLGYRALGGKKSGEPGLPAAA